MAGLYFDLEGFLILTMGFFTFVHTCIFFVNFTLIAFGSLMIILIIFPPRLRHPIFIRLRYLDCLFNKQADS
jgi:hypothetical protein